MGKSAEQVRQQVKQDVKAGRLDKQQLAAFERRMAQNAGKGR